MSSNEETKGIVASIIIEVIGKPPEHLTEALNNMIKSLGEEKGVSINDFKLNAPVVLKSNEEFFCSFAEVEIEVETISHLAGLMFKYMPAHIEILSPALISLDNCGWNDILNELVRRLHGYDEIARVMQLEKEVLEKQLKTILSKEKPKKKVSKKKK
jgi:hypothetical protein